VAGGPTTGRNRRAGEETEKLPDSAKAAAAELGSRGGKARAASMSPIRSKKFAVRLSIGTSPLLTGIR
jgi:hypothetical protein